MKGNRKFYIALNGEVHEVSRKVYQAYYQGRRKEKYIYEKDQVHENHILDISGIHNLIEMFQEDCDGVFNKWDVLIAGGSETDAPKPFRRIDYG